MLGISIFKKNQRREGETFKSPSGSGHAPAIDVIGMACASMRHADVVIPGGGEFKTIFAGLDPSSYCFYTDLLLPRHGEDLLRAGESRPIFSFTLHGVRYSFSAPFESIEMWGGFESLRFRLPGRVKVFQRRNDYRVEPRIDDPVTVIVTAPGAQVARALNISAGGVLLRSRDFISPGSIVNAVVRLPGAAGFMEAKLEILGHLDTGRKIPEHFDLRAKFVDIKDSSVQFIRRYVARRQRELIALLA